MATAKLAIMVSPHANEDGVSIEELLAKLSGQELLAASTETSSIYNGKVLARACAIVQYRLRLHTAEVARRLNVSKGVIYRWAQAHPISNSQFARAMRELAFLLGEGQ